MLKNEFGTILQRLRTEKKMLQKDLKNLLFDENEDGSLDNIVEYNKDEYGNIVAISLDFDGDGIADAKAYLEYDNMGRIVKKSMDKDSDGKIDYVVTYQYDENGKITTHYDDNADGKVDYIESTDENGKTTITDVRGTVQKIAETIKNVFFTK